MSSIADFSAPPNVDISQITSRWKPTQRCVSHSFTNSAVNSVAAPPPPDTRAEFLRLRADLLRREPLISPVPSLENELADALERVRSTELVNNDLRLQVQELQHVLAEVTANFTTSNAQREKQMDTIARLQSELTEAKDTIEALQNEKSALQRMNSLEQQQQRGSSGVPSMSSGNGGGCAAPSPQQAARGIERKSQLLSSNSVVRGAARATSPSLGSSRQAGSTRSPARFA